MRRLVAWLLANLESGEVRLRGGGYHSSPIDLLVKLGKGWQKLGGDGPVMVRCTLGAVLAWARLQQARSTINRHGRAWRESANGFTDSEQ